MLLSSLRAQKLFSILRHRGVTFGGVEIVPFGKSFFEVNLRHSTEKIPLMNPFAEAGVDRNVHVATLKAISEYFERNAWRKGKERGFTSCEGGTDGFAAFPKLLFPAWYARRRAREAAYTEALEHFAKAQWWDNSEVAFSTQLYSMDAAVRAFPAVAPFFVACAKVAPSGKVQVVKPSIGSTTHEVILFLWWFAGGGVTMGGACGRIGGSKHTLVRAASELFRHVLAVTRAQNDALSPQNSYDKRLVFFGTNAGSESVLARLQQRGTETLAVPKIALDVEISHEHQDLAVVWRCLFHGQPEFLGGPLERFCL
jgi:hypothetical protein